MKDFLYKFTREMMKFLQEDQGNNSSRRLIFIYGALIAIPASYYFGFKNKSIFSDIHDVNLLFLASLAGLTTITKFIKK
jgi:hypothetical protein